MPLPVDTHSDVNYDVAMDPRSLQSLAKIEQGALWVKGHPNTNTHDRTWRKRWFAISKLQDEGPLQLHWFELDKDHKGADGSPVILDAAEVRVGGRKDGNYAYEDGGKLDNQFQIELVTGEVLWLAAESKEEMLSWFETLSFAFQLFRHRAACHRIQTDPPSGDLFIANKDDKPTWDFLVDKAQAFHVMGPGIFSAVAGRETEFSVHNTDENMGHCIFTATLSNDDCHYNLHLMDKEHQEEALYACSYCVCSVGMFQLSIKLNGDHHVFGSPFTVQVEPAPCVAVASTARGEGLFAARPGEIMTFTIVAKDAFGNERTEGGDLFEVSLDGPSILKNVADNGNGTYSCAYELSLPSGPGMDPINAGQTAIAINVSLAGKHISGSPFYPKLEARDEVVEGGGGGTAVGTLLGPSGSADPLRPMARNPQHSLPKSPFAKDAMLPAGRRGAPARGRATTQRANGSSDRDLQAAAAKLLSSPPSNGPAPTRNAQRGIVGGGGMQMRMPPPPPAGGSPLAGNTKFQMKQIDDVRSTVLPARQPTQATQGSRLGSLTANLGASEQLTSDIARSASVLTSGHLGAGPYGGDSSSLGSSSMVAASPATGKSKEQEWYQVIVDLDRDTGVQQMFNRHGVQLKEVFEYYAQGGVAGNKQKLLTVGAANERRGLLRLAQDFDISPTFLSKRDVKQIMEGVLKISGSTGTGLDKDWYIRLLGLMAVRALSKPSFQHLYPTYQSKVAVLLEMWGLADPVKLNMVRQQRNR